MSATDRSAFTLAAVLHVLLLGAVVFVAYRSSARTSELQPLVMEMFAPPSDAADDNFFAPSDAAATPDAAPAPAEPEPLLRQPDIAPVASQTYEALRDVPPAPEPEPVAEPEPAPPATVPPAPAPKTPERPKPAEKPAPRPPEKAPVMTAEQFRKQMGLPKTAATTTKPRPAPATPRGGNPPVKIDTSGVTKSLQGMLGGSGSGASAGAARTAQMSAAQQNALLGYFNSLRGNIRAAWRSPENLIASSGEWAEVEITIEANGRISNVRIGRHEASQVYLDSIRRAVQAARPLGPTPTGQREYVRYTLNLRDL